MSPSSSYTLGHHESVLRSHRWRTVENSAAYVLPHLAPGMRVLDVGCGPGTVTAGLGAVVGADGQVLGLDSSADVVAVARAETATTGGGAVRFAVGDGMALGLPDGYFDVVHAHQVLQHVPDPVGALREMRRVTRPGGVVAARDADYAAMTWYPASVGLDRWLSVYRQTARRDGGEPDAGRRLLAWARQAGFTDVSSSASVWCFATAQDRHWWGNLHADRMTDSRLAGKAVAAGVTDRAELHELAEAWRGWSDAADGWFAVLHGEIICRVDAGGPWPASGALAGGSPG
jgi:SAM-dependent methyltransferase